MERVLTAEERIKRAEEIYERRRNQNYRNTTATVNVSGENNDFKLLKKMVIQVLICLLIYFIFYLIQTTNYVFSATTLNKTKEILDYDMDVQGIYTDIKNSLTNNLETEQQDVIEENNFIEENEENFEEIKPEKNLEENKEQEIENTEESTLEVIDNEIIEEENITIAQEILNNYSIIKPAEGGFISSEFGTREEEGDVVTSYHHGIDIAVVTGTEVLSATDGEVILCTESSSYGKYIKVKNGELVTLYAHCNELLVKVGDNVTQGTVIAKSGATGKVTGAHLHFEIIYKDEYINPREILEF